MTEQFKDWVNTRPTAQYPNQPLYEAWFWVQAMFDEIESRYNGEIGNEGKVYAWRSAYALSIAYDSIKKDWGLPEDRKKPLN